MNSHKTDHTLDALFSQALEPFTHATPPRDAPKKLMRRYYGFPLKIQRFVTWVHSFSAQNFMLSNQPTLIAHTGAYRPSPFLGVTLSQISGLRMSS